MRILHSLVALVILVLLNAGCANEPVTNNQDESNETARFSLVPSEDSGIRFSNKIKETFSDNILINSYLYNGGGVAILDVNNDGLSDVYFTATQGPNRLYLNKGQLTFEDITESAGVALASGIKTGVTICDVNKDGLDDIYVCRSGMEPTGERANALYINNGDLTFTESAAEFGLNDRSASNHANFFDYDGDGDLDMYLMNHPVTFKEVNRLDIALGSTETKRPAPKNEWESDRLYRQEANGKFINVSTQAGINNRGWGLSNTISDFNHDGLLDILIGNDYIEPDYLYINNGDGTFTDQNESYFRHTANHTMGVDIADINNDGLMDVVALDMIAEDNLRQKALMTTMMLDRYNTLVRAGYGHQIMRNTLSLNTGATLEQGQVYSEIGVLSGVSNTDWSWSPLIADFDNDGLKDLYVTNGYRRDISDIDYLTYTFDSVMQAGGLNTRQFDSIQQYLELIPTTPLVNYMFRNVNGIEFEKVADSWGMDHPSYSNGSAYADLDNDGDLDILVNQIDREALLYENLSNEQSDNNWLQLSLKGNEQNIRATGAIVRITLPDGSTQHAEVTPVRGFFSSSHTIVHFGLGKFDVATKVEVLWPGGDLIHTLENVTSNQRYLVDQSYAASGKLEPTETTPPGWPKFRSVAGINFTHSENQFIDFDRELMLPHMFSNSGPHSATADVNGDGQVDIYICGARRQAGQLFLQSANGEFNSMDIDVFSTDAIYEDVDAEFIDFDNDGDQDLYVTSGGSSERPNSASYIDRLYINDGSGSFTRAGNDVIPEDRASSSCVAKLDFDSDGNTDLVVGGLVTPGKYPIPPRSRMLRNSGGQFEDVTNSVFPELENLGHIKDIKWSDVTGDGKSELIIAGEWLPISVWSYNGNKFNEITSDLGLDKTNGWWNCIEIADIDGDGDNDIVGGNLGLNTRLKASKEEPLRLYASDFDANNQIDAIMSYYNNGEEYPLATRDMIVKQLPGLKKKYVRNRNYSSAPMAEVFDKRQLRDATVLEAYEFSNVWYENDNGSFRRRQLNIEAQIAPCFAILVDDLNADGITDLILAGNDYGSDVESGRYDAGNGTVLLGTGNGTFEVAHNRFIDFWATGQVREIVSISMTGGNTIVVLNNNAAAQTYTIVK